MASDHLKSCKELSSGPEMLHWPLSPDQKAPDTEGLREETLTLVRLHDGGSTSNTTTTIVLLHTALMDSAQDIGGDGPCTHILQAMISRYRSWLRG